MLKDSYKKFLECAYRVPNFKQGTKEKYKDIETLAMGYINAENTNNRELQEGYLSALMIRYWYMIPYVYEQSRSLRVDYDDIVIWLYEAFSKAFKYKSWIDQSKQASKEKNGAEKCFNRCIDSIRQGYFQQSNTDSRRVNYTTLAYEDCTNNDKDFTENTFLEDVKLVISNRVTHNNILSAVILDNLCFNDCFSKNSFSMRKLVSNLDKDYIKSFIKRYQVSSNVKQYLEKLPTLSRNKLNNMIEDCLKSMQQDEEVRSLCYQM